MNNQILTSLSIITSFHNKDKSVIDAFLPIVEYGIATLNKETNHVSWQCLCKDKYIIPGIPRPFCSCFHIDKKVCAEIDKVLYEGYTPSEAKKEFGGK